MSAKTLTRERVHAHLLKAFGLEAETIAPLASYADQNFRVQLTDGRTLVFKVARPQDSRLSLLAQNAAMNHLEVAAPSLCCPRVVPTRTGEGIASLNHQGHTCFTRALSWIPGDFLANVTPQSPALLTHFGEFLGTMSRALSSFSHSGAHRHLQCDLSKTLDMAKHLPCIADLEQRRMVEHCVLHIEMNTPMRFNNLRRSVIHNDANDHNVVVDPTQPDRIAGLIDFGDLVFSYTVAELAVGCAYAMLDTPDPLGAASQVIRGFHTQYALTNAEVSALYDMILCRLTVSLLSSARASVDTPDNTYITISEAPIWRLLHQLMCLPRDLPITRFQEAIGQPTTAPPKRDELVQRRRTHFAANLSLHYKRPLHVVRGIMQTLYAEDGASYLDLVNNVCHVGHCHPTVVRAAARQMAQLNTNSRYLHEERIAYGQRLCATLPAGLDVCFLVCSGSEANELALRLARTHTGRDAVVVADSAYHGHTTSLIGLSPYKLAGPGGGAPPTSVRVVPTADAYRGPYRGPASGIAYAHTVADAFTPDANGSQPGAFFIESLSGCGGQIVPPEHYLRASFEAVRSAGGVCVADEVQVGFGRVGSHFWGFEAQGAIPDIVTMGKPIGNGHPLAAVVTTKAIAASFHNGMEYFNTFGGNPVSCVVGNTVLEIIEREGLQAHAAELGAFWLEELQALMERHPLIGEVRGKGLFLGIELVRNRETLEPAATEASTLVEHLRDAGILMSTDGPHHNVLKIKPPMVIQRRDVERTLAALDAALKGLSP